MGSFQKGTKMESNEERKYKYYPKKRFYLRMEQLKESIKPGKMTVDIERELKLYSPKKNPLESVRLPPLAAIGPAVMGRLPDEGYADCTEWLSSPVPGFRTQPKLDPTRTIACSEKNSLIYRQDCGLIPKYAGYVPGERFRYGRTYGHLTNNSKEICSIGSKTWGGAVSINIGNGS